MFVVSAFTNVKLFVNISRANVAVFREHSKTISPGANASELIGVIYLSDGSVMFCVHNLFSKVKPYQLGVYKIASFPYF